MPSGKNWVNFMYVNIAFAMYIAGVFYYSKLSEIKTNWPLYRCNPMYMPLADNIEENFTYCIQNVQANYMGFILEPLTFITGNLGGMIGGLTGELQGVRAMFNKIRTMSTSAIQSIFGVFLNLIIEFQRITIGIKDLIGKTIGIMVSLLYIMDGSIKTMNSVWSGPPGQLVQSLGKCFHPDTKIKLLDGTIKSMKFVDLGDILEDGAFVESILKIDNTREPVTLYEIEDSGVERTTIYVTGSHLVYDKSSGKFIQVKDYIKAKVVNITTDYFNCLITSNHKICIGGEIFWDWEDHFIK